MGIDLSWNVANHLHRFHRIRQKSNMEAHPLRNSVQGNSSEGSNIVDCHFQLETQWRCLQYMKALNWIPTIGIIPCLATPRRVDECRSTCLQMSCGW
jgi:hypothetical protein